MGESDENPEGTAGWEGREGHGRAPASAPEPDAEPRPRRTRDDPGRGGRQVDGSEGSRTREPAHCAAARRGKHVTVTPETHAGERAGGGSSRLDAAGPGGLGGGCSGPRAPATWDLGSDQAPAPAATGQGLRERASACSASCLGWPQAPAWPQEPPPHPTYLHVSERLYQGDDLQLVQCGQTQDLSDFRGAVEKGATQRRSRQLPLTRATFTHQLPFTPATFTRPRPLLVGLLGDVPGKPPQSLTDILRLSEPCLLRNLGKRCCSGLTQPFALPQLFSPKRYRSPKSFHRKLGHTRNRVLQRGRQAGWRANPPACLCGPWPTVGFHVLKWLRKIERVLCDMKTT